MKSTRVLVSAVIGLVLVLGLCMAATGPPTRVAAAPPIPVWYAINNGTSFQVSASPIAEAAASSTIDNNGFRFYINPTSGYADAGIVLYFDGSLTLGALDNLSITGTGADYAANLWLDVDNNSSFFSFLNGVYQGRNGDTYGTVVNSSNGALQISDGSIYRDSNGYGNHTLAELKSGSLGWVSGGTRVAIWIGNSGSTTETTHLMNVVVNGSSLSCYQVPTATGTGIATFWPTAGPMQNLAARPIGYVSAQPPSGLIFGYGLFEFDITGLASGASVTVTIELPSAIPAGSQYWKYNSVDGWYQIPLLDNNGDNIIAIQLTDGGTGDDDHTQNGSINDQGGPGWPPTGGGATSAPAFPSIYVGIGAALGAGILAYFVSKRQAKA